MQLRLLHHTGLIAHVRHSHPYIALYGTLTSGEAGGEATQLALTDAVEALRQHRAERTQIELILRARVIGDDALKVVTKALNEEVDTAGAAVAAAEGMDEAAQAKAQADLEAAKEHVRLHTVQKTDIAARRVAAGTSQGQTSVVQCN